MAAVSRLSPRTRRKVLELLNRDRLSELTTAFGLEVDDRRSGRSHVDAIVQKRSLDFRLVLEALTRDELKAGCEALNLDTVGREKAKLVERILGCDSPGAESAGHDNERNGTRLADDSHDVNTDAQDSAADSSTAVDVAATQTLNELKSKLRRFVIEIAGGIKGRTGPTEFVSRLLQCFGWPDGKVPEVLLPSSLSVVINGKRVAREVALLWPTRRVLAEVVKHDVMLDFAWKELLGICLQTDPPPQYVVLTNQRDLQLFDLARDRNVPRLSIPVDDLPKYSEAFPFLLPAWTPGMLPKIINVSKVSGEVAALVARLYRSLKEQHPNREGDVVRFTLQCILTMFAEDIRLLPQEYFTSLLYEGARAGDVEERLRELFRLMSTRDVPGPREIPFFNGGLFTNPVTLPLGEAQLTALTKASEANWKYVDPHIFGSVFQGIMNDAERHKSGAHYTAHDDIMRVVGPTIVDPWRQRIRAAKSLSELMEVRADLLKFRVLDPACGSGNFLYVAFRELYRLDTELLARLREFPSTQEQGKTKIGWGAGIQASNFFGIDINPFAVELAKVTLNIAKKIAFDERREVIAELVGQMEFDVDPSLPLDNLDKNIVCADALFTDWPDVEAIVGNPPFLGARKIRKELGVEYMKKLQADMRSDTLVDMACYWFRLSHDRLPAGGRAGLVGTSAIRVGNGRAASLDYLVANGATIVNAVSSKIWPGEAAVNVSMVNWVKGPATGPFQLTIGNEVHSVPRISSHLQLHCDLSSAVALNANERGMAMGVIFGHEAFASTAPGFPDHRSPGVRLVATGDDMLRGKLTSSPDRCIYLPYATEDEARTKGGASFIYLRERVYPAIKARAESGQETQHYSTWLRKWWKPQQARDEFMTTLQGLPRYLVFPKVVSRPIFMFLSRAFVPNPTLLVFSLQDDYSFGVLQSALHWDWTKAQGGRVTDRIQYNTNVWRTFPWPQEPMLAEVHAVADAARHLRHVRDALMKQNGWSLRALYQAAEVAGPHLLNEAQAALDEAVRQAYGMPTDQDPTEFLLELNKLVAEDEAQGRHVQGPGIPRGVDPKDPRLMSTDCIEPPPL